MKTFLAFTTGLLGGIIVGAALAGDVYEKEKLEKELETLKANEENTDE